jgi:arsenate reductase
MTAITIYHNPLCGTSRNVLALIRNTGQEPQIIEYLQTPPTLEKLRELIAQSGLSARELMREKEATPAELALDGEALLQAMLLRPILINRPIVVSPLGTRLCRPSELVLDILPLPQLAALAKEDGQKLVDASGQRIL